MAKGLAREVMGYVRTVFLPALKVTLGFQDCHLSQGNLNARLQHSKISHKQLNYQDCGIPGFLRISTLFVSPAKHGRRRDFDSVSAIILVPSVTLLVSDQ